MTDPFSLNRRQVLAGLGASVTVLSLDAYAQPVPPKDRVTLTAATLRKRLTSEAKEEASLVAFNGSLPGPLLRAKRGEELKVRLENKLTQPTSLHWHGWRGPNARDGVSGLTQEAVAPEAGLDIDLTLKDIGLVWYRPLHIPNSLEQTARGLSGLLIVDEDKPQAVDQDLVFILQDWLVNEDGTLKETFNELPERIFGRLGGAIIINGVPAPHEITLPPQGRVRLRILNAATARAFPMRFTNVKATILAVDGQPTEPYNPKRDSLTAIPGSRFDMIIEAPNEPSVTGAIQAVFPNLETPLLTIKVEGRPSVFANSPIEALAANDLPGEINLGRATRVELTIDRLTETQDLSKLWRFNGLSWAEHRAKPVMSVKRGTPVVMSFINPTDLLQCLHIHGHHVRLLHSLDDGWEPYWLDTVAVPAGRTVRIAFIADNPGQWMIGSANVARLNSGLAAWFEVKE